jgi:hypothetical protein
MDCVIAALTSGYQLDCKSTTQNSATDGNPTSSAESAFSAGVATFAGLGGYGLAALFLAAIA